MLTATPAHAGYTCRVTTVPELEREYSRARFIYERYCAAGDIGTAMIHLSNVMRIWRSLQWVRQVRAIRSGSIAPPPLRPKSLLGSERQLSGGGHL